MGKQFIKVTIGLGWYFLFLLSLFLITILFSSSAFAGTIAEQITNTSGIVVTQSAVGPLIEVTPYGEINWTDGYVIAYGKGKISRGLNKDVCVCMAERTAILDARSRAFQMIEKINLDGDITVKDFVSKDSRLFYRLKGLIARVKPLKQYVQAGFYNVEMKIPFYGVYGIEVVFLSSYVKSNNKRIKGLSTDDRIIIDARGTGLKPSLFVKVKDQTGKNVYSAKDVDMAYLQDKGMVQYVTSTTMQPGDVSVKALKADGRQNGNIVISSSDAAIFMQMDKDSVLSKDTVLVIMDPPIN